MYLKQLEINGFKSFAKKSDLLFTTAISGIVGPNGSGKSNVAEAFRFVLGEQSVKNMRGKKGEDLIFTGAAGRSNRGVVKVIFDNRKKILDIDYDEVSIERIVNRDGSNEYKINGSAVRAKDIAELLSGANIGASGHHIISQGEADKILSINPKERKVVLQEALGLKMYAMKKGEAERKLERSGENLKEVLAEQRTVAPRINYLKREVEKVKKAQDMKEELRSLYKQFFPQKKNIQRELDVQNQHITDFSKQVTEIDAKILALQKELQNVTKETGVEEKTEKLIAVEKKLQSLRQDKAEKERLIGKTEAKIEMALTQKERYEAHKDHDESSDKLEVVARWSHNVWMEWAKELLQTENLSQERKDRWDKCFVAYEDLGQAKQDLDRKYARELLSELDGTPQAALEPFDESILTSLGEEKENLVAEIAKLGETEKELETKRDELDDLRDSQETVSQKVQIEILTIEKEKSVLLGTLNGHKNQREKLESQMNIFGLEEAAARDMFGVETDEFFQATGSVVDSELNVRDKIMRLKVLLENSNLSTSASITEEYDELVKHKEFIDTQVADLQQTAASLQELIVDLQEKIDVQFREGLEKINKEFAKFFQTLFSGGRAEIFLTDVPIRKEHEDDPQEYEIGVDLSVSLPNKKVKGLSMLSGGERSLTSIALLFAMSSVTPPPFIILDETDAALDEANSKRYGDMIELLAQDSQLIVITHNRETMSRAGILYGVTMGNDGASRLLSVSLDQAEQVAK